MWTTYLPSPQKLLWKKQQNNDALCKKDFVRPHINLLGTCVMWYLHKADNVCCEGTQRFVLDQATTLGERNQPFALDARKFYAVCRYYFLSFARTVLCKKACDAQGFRLRSCFVVWYFVMSKMYATNSTFSKIERTSKLIKWRKNLQKLGRDYVRSGT